MHRRLQLLSVWGLFAVHCSVLAHDVTIVTEFSDSNAAAYAQQMQHWQILLQNTAELRVDYVHVGIQRGFELLSQSGYCTINKLKTAEREARWLFSARPINLSSSLRLITLDSASLAESAGEAPAFSEVDLQDWLRHPARRKVGVVAGSSYGAAIDHLIKSRPNQFYQLHGQDVSVKLWQMLKRGRIDAMLDYPVRINQLRLVQQDTTAYTASALRGQPLHLEGYIVCNRQAHGQALIRYLDELMAQPALQQQLVASYRQYFNAAEWQQLQPYLTQTFNAVF